MISCVVRKIASQIAVGKLFFLRNHRKKADYGESSSTTNKSGLLMGNSFSTTPHPRKKRHMKTSNQRGRTCERLFASTQKGHMKTSNLRHHLAVFIRPLKYTLSLPKKPELYKHVSYMLFTDQSSHSSGYLRSFFIEFCDQNGTDCGFPNEVNRSLNLRFHGSFFELACFQITLCISQ